MKAAVERLEWPTRKPKEVALRPKLVVRGTTSKPRSGARRMSVDDGVIEIGHSG